MYTIIMCMMQIKNKKNKIKKKIKKYLKLIWKKILGYCYFGINN